MAAGVGLPSCFRKIEWSGQEDERLFEIPQVVWLGLHDDSLHSAAVRYYLPFAVGGGEEQGNV